MSEILDLGPEPSASEEVLAAGLSSEEPVQVPFPMGRYCQRGRGQAWRS